MDDSQAMGLAAWIAEAGLEGQSETAMVTGFCERALRAGVPLANTLVLIDTLHPVHEGHVVRWHRDKAETTLAEYGRTTEGPAAENWRRSPFYRLLETGETMLRRRIDPAAAGEFEFPILAELRAQGRTEYLCLINRFAAEGVIGEMDCVYSSWATDRPQGFGEGDVAALVRLVPFLAAAMKGAALAGIARTLVETYLGRDAGRMVLRGRIARGVADRIGAVLWFSDLRGYTGIADRAPPEQIIPLLNDYAEAVVSSIHEAGGDVLKLIGDGVLAIFRAEEDPGRACRSALGAATAAGARVAKLNRRRAEAGLPTTEIYLGLHIGAVFFGNVGSKERLDFTVVGPAVNEASRIAAMCRSVDRPVLVSADFARALGEPSRLVSVGRYALRGVGHPQELFTLDPEAQP